MLAALDFIRRLPLLQVLHLDLSPSFRGPPAEIAREQIGFRRLDDLRIRLRCHPGNMPFISRIFQWLPIARLRRFRLDLDYFERTDDHFQTSVQKSFQETTLSPFQIHNFKKVSYQ